MKYLKSLVRVVVVISFIAGLVAPAVSGAEKKEGEAKAYVLQAEAYAALQAANTSNKARDLNRAQEYYEKARSLYAKLKSDFPEWQPNTVKFRLSYCEKQLSNLDILTQDDDVEVVQKGHPELQKALKKGKAYLEKYQYTKASKTFTEAMSEFPNEEGLVKGAVYAYLCDQDIKNVQKIVEGLNTKMKGDPAISFMLGLSYYADGKYDQCVTILKKTIKKDQTNPFAFNVLGAAYLNLNNVKSAKGAYITALSIEPELVDAQLSLARILATGSAKDKKAAVNHYQKALSLGAAPDGVLEALVKN